jgi:hypothetical protein
METMINQASGSDRKRKNQELESGAFGRLDDEDKGLYNQSRERNRWNAQPSLMISLGDINQI